MTYHLAAGQPGDLDAIVELLLNQYDEIGTFRLHLPTAREGIADVLENGHAILLKIDGQIVGYLGLYHYQPWYSDEAALADRGLFIHREHRSLFTFRMLVAAAAEIARMEKMQFYLFLNCDEPDRKERLFSRYGDEVLKGWSFRPFGGMFHMKQGG